MSGQEDTDVRDFLVVTCEVTSMEGEPHLLGAAPWKVIEGDGTMRRFCSRNCLTWHYGGGSE